MILKLHSYYELKKKWKNSKKSYVLYLNFNTLNNNAISSLHFSKSNYKLNLYSNHLHWTCQNQNSYNSLYFITNSDNIYFCNDISVINSFSNKQIYTPFFQDMAISNNKMYSNNEFVINHHFFSKHIVIVNIINIYIVYYMHVYSLTVK